LERPNILPKEGNEKGYERLDARVVSLLLAALPTTLKSELIAARKLTCLQVIFRILKTYQPGGQGEKAQTLASLTSTKASKSVPEALESLRTWRRYLLRARELRLVTPDPLLLVGVLSEVTRQVLQQDQQAQFRVTSFH